MSYSYGHNARRKRAVRRQQEQRRKMLIRHRLALAAGQEPQPWKDRGEIRDRAAEPVRRTGIRAALRRLLDSFLAWFMGAE